MYRLLIVLAWLSLSLPTLAQTDLDCADLAPEGVEPGYYLGQGDAFFAAGDYTRAINNYTCAIEAQPDFAPAYVNRGYAYVQQGNDDQALDDYNRALELDETLVAGYINRGILYTRQGNFGLALLDLDLAVALEPDNAIGYHNRALVHAAEGNYDLAMDDLEQAITLAPDFAAPHAALGAVYSALAVRSYADYRQITGESSRLPMGEADTTILELERSLETGSFAIWLPLQTPAQAAAE